MQIESILVGVQQKDIMVAIAPALGVNGELLQAMALF